MQVAFSTCPIVSVTFSIFHPKQYTTELILLTDDGALKSQMDEDDDIFQYFKFKAERGDLEAQVVPSNPSYIFYSSTPVPV